MTEETMRWLPLVIPLVLIQIGLMVAALADLLRHRTTRGPRWAWTVVIIAFGTIGPLAYFLFGRSDE